MKRLTPILSLTLSLCLLALAGCADKEISVALQTYTATVDYLSTEREAGRISDDTQANVIAPAREAAKAVLDEIVDAYVAGREFDWRGSLTRFYAALGPLLRTRTVLEGSHAH